MAISWALASDTNNDLSAELKELEEVKVILNAWLDEYPQRNRLYSYFTKHAPHFNRSCLTLEEFIERLAEMDPMDEVDRHEMHEMSAKAALQVLNMPFWIRQDAEAAAEPFLLLLR
ncbi:MAG: hypothetical protein AAB517_01950 [Patescibacteria group bacterium]